MAGAKELSEQATTLFNKGDIEGQGALYADDAVLVTPDGRFEGRQSIQEVFQGFVTSFPDAQVTTGRGGEDGELFFGEFTFAGTNTGPLSMPDGTELPATGKPVEVHSTEIVHAWGGRIVQADMLWDNMAFMTQLGLVPAP